jgi:23S rRNA (pseudouridine1915-N3)-methyltransferase
MNIAINVIGKEKDRYINEQINEYLKRVPWKIKFQEYPSIKNSSHETTKLLEGKSLLSKTPPEAYVIALDEKGKEFSSIELANFWQTKLLSKQHINIIIGGAFGLSEEIKTRANYTLSLSKLTFPHKLVRIIIAEQLYRVYSIINNHPYHKE